MKNLTLIVHADVQQALADTLASSRRRALPTPPVEGHGAQGSHDSALSARDSVVGCTPQVRVDI